MRWRRWVVRFKGRVKSWIAPVIPIHRTQRFCTRGCAPTKKNSLFDSTVRVAQLLGSCLFSSTINNIFHCSNFNVFHVVNCSNNSKITKNHISCNLPFVILLNVVMSRHWSRGCEVLDGSIDETLERTRGFKCSVVVERTQNVDRSTGALHDLTRPRWLLWVTWCPTDQ